jgi:FAD/FMN-containing dehydrogenase
MRTVLVSITSQHAHAQGGALLGDVDAATVPRSLVVPSGVVSETGMTGLTLGGGLGWLRRKHGFSADSLVSAQVVTADGRCITANEHEHADLLWGLRGGGWGLGIVCELEFRTHPLPQEVMTILVAYPGKDARRVLQAYREYGRNAPEAFGALAVLGTFPEAAGWPREVWGQEFALIIGPYAAPVEEGERAVQPLRELGAPLLDMSGPMPFLKVQTLFDEDYPAGKRYYWKSVYLDGLGDDVIDKLIDLASRRASAESTVDVWLQGGALTRVPTGGSPLDEHRRAPFLIGLEANWDYAVDDTANRDWCRTCAAELMPFSTGGSYLNFEDLGEEKAAAASRGRNQQRLIALKRTYDPNGLFHAPKSLFA